MSTKLQRPTHKLGANRKETARKARKHDANFAQSRDIREDRGERQIKAVRRNRRCLILRGDDEEQLN
ncbi:MAG: hypothetical protein HY043_24175 [Verrucomicrobia bacterium]|nr:hypothetical protein [Verrucomicrobiota bacterium]